MTIIEQARARALEDLGNKLEADVLNAVGRMTSIAEVLGGDDAAVKAYLVARIALMVWRMTSESLK